LEKWCCNKFDRWNKNAEINSLIVVNNDVYAVGYESIRPYSNLVAKFWKNGAETMLTNGTSIASAESIAVNGNDVFIAGYEFYPSTSEAKYWKNGILSNEVNGSKMVKAQSIAVYGKDIFIAGYSMNSSGLYGQATYCKNGVLNVLDNIGFTTSIANSIFVTE
jgi:hypothetical protein